LNPISTARPAIATPTEAPRAFPRPKPEARRAVLRAAMVVVDAALVTGLLAVATGGNLAAPTPTPAFLTLAVVSALLWIGALGWVGGYDIRLLGRRAELATRLLRAAFIAVILQVVADFILRPALAMPGRLELTLFWALTTLGVIGVRWTFWRWMLVKLLAGAINGSVVVVGADPRSEERSRQLLRWMLLPPAVEAVVDGPDSADQIERLAAEGRIDQVLVAREDLPRDMLIALVQRCVGWGLTVVVASPAFNVMIGRAPVFILDGMPVLEIQPSGLFTPARHVKRAIDFTGALVGGLLLAPLLLVIALLIKTGSRGPVLYRQERVGRGGKVFHFYKFRSMVVNSDEQLHRAYLEKLVKGGEEASLDHEGRKIYKLVDDPRVTPVGSFLRRTSLDELPQLWNILKGEMSLVGPRPCLPYEWDLHKEWQKRRLDVTPGLTGLWQVTGRSRVPFDDMVLLDLYYIAHWSIGLDIELILRTVPVMFSGRGGH
jgi:exopolysaccharide biosynthesis polyprenyl glycosylphosphotransferase